MIYFHSLFHTNNYIYIFFIYDLKCYKYKKYKIWDISSNGRALL